MRIAVEAHAKINWSLDIRGQRENGYHELNMLMQPIELSDELTFQRARWLSLTVDGHRLPLGSRNLVLRAAQALNEYMGKRFGANIALKKRIPVRAGLGGGSADCAATLLALNRLWGLRLPMEKLAQIGEGLGADVPFCLYGGFARVTGIGEKMERLDKAERFALVLLHPGKGLSTQQVFEEFDRGAYPCADLDAQALSQAILDRDLDAMGRLSRNALEAPAIRLLPEIAQAMRDLAETGARVVRMTGSGSAVFGVYSTEAEAQQAHARLPGSIFTWTRE